MTTLVVAAKEAIGTIRLIFIAPISTPVSIETHDGILTTEQSRSVQNAIEGLRTFLLSGEISLDDIGEIAITLKQNDEPGSAESSPKQREKRLPPITEPSLDELSKRVVRARPE